MRRSFSDKTSDAGFGDAKLGSMGDGTAGGVSYPDESVLQSESSPDSSVSPIPRAFEGVDRREEDFAVFLRSLILILLGLTLHCKACFCSGLPELRPTLVAGSCFRSHPPACKELLRKTDGSAVDLHLAKAIGLSLLLMNFKSSNEMRGGDK